MIERSWWQAALFEPPPHVVVEIRFDTVMHRPCWWQIQVVDRQTKELLGLEAHPIQPSTDPLRVWRDATDFGRQVFLDHVRPFA